MVRKRRDFMCPLNRVFGIFGLSHNFWVVAVQDKASNTTKDANTPQLLLIGLHFGYTLATHIFPTPHAHFCYTFTTHLVITNAPHLLHFAYTFATLICHTLATLFLDFSQTLTTPSGNQKCATFVTLWPHSVFPHHMYTFATLSFPHFDCTFGSPKMRHMCYTLATLSIPTPHVHFCYTFATLFFPTLWLHHLLIKNAPHLSHFGYTFHSHTTCTLLLHFSFPHSHYTIC
jgi:hypothetical protein